MKGKRKCFYCKQPAKYLTSDNKGNCGDVECSMDHHKRLQAKLKERQAKELRKETKTRKEAMLTVSDWTKKAQVEFNKYIRQRDKDLPCISCGRYDGEIEGFLRGGKWDAGHFLSRGAFPELRFEPDNCHKQCKSCNGGSGKFAKKSLTVSQEYRVRLVKRIGIERVEEVEKPHPAKRYRIDDLKEIHQKYKQLNKEMEYD